MSSLLELVGCGIPAGLKGIFADLVESELGKGGPPAKQHGPCFHRVRGFQSLTDGKPRAAQAAFADAISKNPDDIPAAIGLACALDELGAVAHAIAQLEHALRHQPNISAAWFALGFCREKLGDFAAAVECYRAALRLQPLLHSAHQRLAALHLRSGELNAAIEDYEQLAWINPGDVDVSIRLAHLYAQAGRLSDAISRYEFAIAIESATWSAPPPESPGSDHERNRMRPAKSILELVREGARLRKSGRRMLAAERFHEAIARNDRMLLAHVGLGAAHAAVGCVAEAEHAFQLAAATAPITAMLHAEVARLEPSGAERRPAGRSASLERAARRRPDDADLHYRLGLHRESAGNRSQAGDAYIQALAIYPDHTKALARLAVILFETGDVGGAVSAAGRAVAPGQNAVSVHHALGLISADAREFKRAVSRLGLTLGKDYDGDFAAHLRLALSNMGLLREASCAADDVVDIAALP